MEKNTEGCLPFPLRQLEFSVWMRAVREVDLKGKGPREVSLPSHRSS